MAASVPPAIMASASPRWMMRKASPMEWAEEVQAVAVASFGPARAEADGDVAGGEIDDGAGDEEGRDFARTSGQHGRVLALDDVEAADAGADVDADAVVSWSHRF